MTSKITLIFAAALLLAAILIFNLVVMAAEMPLAEIAATLWRGEADTYQQSVLLYQQIPRSLIAIYVGATTAVSGCVLQGLVRNPLASPSTLGLNAGATLFVIAGALVFDFSPEVQGLVALAGAGFGFAACFFVARLAGRSNDPRGLSLILAGALVSMLLIGVTNALLLSNPTRRAEFLSLGGWQYQSCLCRAPVRFLVDRRHCAGDIVGGRPAADAGSAGCGKGRFRRCECHAHFPGRALRHHAGLRLGSGDLRPDRFRRPHRAAYDQAAGGCEFHARLAGVRPCRGRPLRAGRSWRANPVCALCGQYWAVHGPAWRPRFHRHRQTLLSFALGKGLS